ncbi:transposase [Buttiauxella ferragutiae]|uniref:transposase n=1 Tax=Buttiauxella ferragutiae TaxID=82989 RepID=UPI00352313DA
MSKVFTAEFKLEATKLVLDQNYTCGEAAKAMNNSLSAINRWVKSLCMERKGKIPPGLPLTSDKFELRENCLRNNLSSSIRFSAYAYQETNEWYPAI